MSAPPTVSSTPSKWKKIHKLSRMSNIVITQGMVRSPNVVHMTPLAKFYYFFI